MKFTQKNYITLYLIGILLAGIAAWWVFKPAAYFDMTVVVKDDATHQIVRQAGALSLDLGTEKRRMTLNPQGEAHFIGLPVALRDHFVALTLEMSGYNLPKTFSQIKLGNEAVTVSVQAIALRLSGQVQDTQQQPVANAQVVIAQYHTQTDENGWFMLTVPSVAADGTQKMHITALGFKPYQIPAIADEHPLTFVLQRSK